MCADTEIDGGMMESGLVREVGRREPAPERSDDARTPKDGLIPSKEMQLVETSQVVRSNKMFRARRRGGCSTWVVPEARNIRHEQWSTFLKSCTEGFVSSGLANEETRHTFA
jgi:hypothetical protein